MECTCIVVLVGKTVDFYLGQFFLVTIIGGHFLRTQTLIDTTSSHLFIYLTRENPGLLRQSLKFREIASCHSEKCWFWLFQSPTCFLSLRKLHEVNFKSDLTQTFPDTYSSRQHGIFIWRKHLECLMKRQRNVILKSELFYIVQRYLSKATYGKSNST